MLVRPLLPTEAPLYVALRHEMLADAPWAFGASPQDDTRLDPDRVARNVRHGETNGGYTLIGAFVEANSTPTLVGTAELMRDSTLKTRNRADIYSVYVTPPYRAQGAASQVIAEAKRIARTWPGVNSLRLSVSVRSPGAQRVYERAGFVAWGHEPACLHVNGEFIDEIHMVCML